MMDKDWNPPTADATKPKDVKKSSGRTEEVQRGSPSPAFAADEKALPHYLTASAGSCHDYCKYGHKVAVERKEKHHVSLSAKEDENRSKVSSKVDGRKLLVSKTKSESGATFRASGNAKFTNVNVLRTPNEIGSSGESMNATTSVPHRNPSGTCADHGRIAISRREASERKPEPRARVHEIHEDGPKGRPTPIGSSSAEERPSLHVKKAAAFTGPVLMRQRSRVKVSGHARTRCIQLDLLESSEEMASKNISDNKPCEKTSAPHAKKVSASVATVFARQRSRTKRPVNAKTQSMLVELLNASEEVYPDVEPPMSTPFVPQNSKSSGKANTGDSEGTQADHISKSKARHYMNRVPSLKKRSVRKADTPGEPRHESASKAEEKRASRRRSAAANGDNSRPSDPSKLGSVSRKTVEDGPKEEKGPSRLMFRKGGTLGKSPSVRGPLWRRSFSRKRSSRGGIVVDPDTGAQVVVLRHQGSMKRDAPGLFNVVIEETASKLVNTRKSRVKALVGAFESVISSLHGKTGNSK